MTKKKNTVDSVNKSVTTTIATAGATQTENKSQQHDETAKSDDGDRVLVRNNNSEEYLHMHAPDETALKRCQFGPFHVNRITHDAMSSYDGKVEAEAYANVTDAEAAILTGESVTLICKHGESEYRTFYKAMYAHVIDAASCRTLLDGDDSALDQLKHRISRAISTYATMTARSWADVALASRLYSHERRDDVIAYWIDANTQHNRPNLTIDAWHAIPTLSQSYLTAWMGHQLGTVDPSITMRITVRALDVLGRIAHEFETVSGPNNVNAGAPLFACDKQCEHFWGHNQGNPTPAYAAPVNLFDAQVRRFLFEDGALPETNADGYCDAVGNGGAWYANTNLNDGCDDIAQLIIENTRMTRYTLNDSGLLVVDTTPANQTTALNDLAQAQFNELVRFQVLAVLSSASFRTSNYVQVVVDGQATQELRDIYVFDRLVFLSAIAALNNIADDNALTVQAQNAPVLVQNWPSIAANHLLMADLPTTMVELVAHLVATPTGTATTQNLQRTSVYVANANYAPTGADATRVVQLAYGPDNEPTLDGLVHAQTMAAIDQNRYTHSRSMYYQANDDATRWLHLQTHAMLAGYNRRRLYNNQNAIPLNAASLFAATNIWVNSIAGSDFKRLPADISAGIIALRTHNPAMTLFPTVDDMVIFSANAVIAPAEMRATDAATREQVLTRNLQTMRLTPWPVLTAQQSEYDEQKFIYAHQAVGSVLRRIPDTELLPADRKSVV